MKKDRHKHFEVIYYEDFPTVELRIGLMRPGLWNEYIRVLDAIEQFISSHEATQLDLQCQMVDDTSSLYVMHVLKLAERYQWAGGKTIKVNCDLGMGESYRCWLKDKLNRSLTLDISFTHLVAQSTFF